MKNHRQTRLARIHILRKELGLSDMEYRQLLSRGWGVTSASQLTDDDLSQAVATFQGMQIEAHKTPKTTIRESNLKNSSKKIWAEWYKLAQYLPEEKRTTVYLLGIAQRNAPGLAIHAGNLNFDTCINIESIKILKSLIQATRHARKSIA